MMSAAARVSPLASASGLPCSWVSSGAMSPARSRIRAAALRMILLRSAGSVSRQTSKPFCAASSAWSRSGRPACATRPISLPVAGFTTGSVFPSAGACHLPLMKSCVSMYPMAILESGLKERDGNALLQVFVRLVPEARRADGEEHQVLLAEVGNALARRRRNQHHVAGTDFLRRQVGDLDPSPALQDHV